MSPGPGPAGLSGAPGADVEPTGRFRVYLGAAPGVGKTVAMLEEGQRRRGRGTDVVAGLVETHGRPFTASHLEGLEVVPRLLVPYKGRRYPEMDLAAVLARRPAVALVDELAHTNVPGSGPHPKRWEDVVDLLDAGVSVITTVNIQHLESLADTVERITRVPVRERVPDWVVRRADQIELVDSSPEQLRRRMAHGNIYPLEQVGTALTHFFRQENLTGLRELALRFVADKIDESVQTHVDQRGLPEIWETAERILVGLADPSQGDLLLRRAARIAARVKGELLVLRLGGDDGVVDRRAEAALARARQLTADLGGRWAEVQGPDPAADLVAFAREHQITQIVVGATLPARWSPLSGRRTLVERVMRAAGAAGIDVHIIAVGVQPPGGGEPAA